MFIGDSVRSLAARIPLPLPTQWRVSAAFLCLCPLSEMQPGLGKPQHSTKRLASRLTDSDGHVLRVFTEHRPSLFCHSLCKSVSVKSSVIKLVVV